MVIVVLQATTQATENKKAYKQWAYRLIWRRKRDSNPRRCDPQQFSRLPHSTTLPFLLAVMRVQI